MRIKPEIRAFLKETSANLFPNAGIYLFGSRTDNQARGGDIDILILSKKKIAPAVIRTFRISFYKKFGYQKIDVVNFTEDEKTTFKQIILSTAQPI